MAMRAQTAELRARERYARDLVRAGKQEQAIRIYRELLQVVSDNPTLIMNFAIALFKAGHHREVTEQCQAALRLRPDLSTAWLYLGASYHQLGESERALEPLHKVLRAQPQERNARLVLAEALLRLERYEEAVGHFREAVELLSDNPRAWFGLGWACENLSREAFVALEKSAAESAYWHALVGDARRAQQQYASALHHYRQAFQRKPNLRGVHAARADVYRQTGHLESAAVEDEKERQLGPPDCWSEQMACDFNSGRHWQIVVRLASQSSPESWYWRSKAYDALAEHAFARLAALPPSSQLHELKARTLDDRGRHLQAAAEWQEALQLAPRTLHLKKGWAASLYQGRNYAAALPLLEELLRLEPGSADVNFLYGSSMLNLERPEDAVAPLTKALTADPELLAAHAELGRAYLQLGQAEQAVPHLEAGLALDQDGSSYYRLSRAYRLAGNRERAQQTLKRYRQMRQEAELRRQRQESATSISPP